MFNKSVGIEIYLSLQFLGSGFTNNNMPETKDE
jgi:hypothetical protein